MPTLLLQKACSGVERPTGVEVQRHERGGADDKRQCCFSRRRRVTRSLGLFGIFGHSAKDLSTSQYYYLTPGQRAQIMHYILCILQQSRCPNASCAIVHDFTASPESSDILQAKCPVSQVTRSLAGREYPEKQISKCENKASGDCTFNLSTNLR